MNTTQVMSALFFDIINSVLTPITPEDYVIYRKVLRPSSGELDIDTQPRTYILRH